MPKTWKCSGRHALHLVVLAGLCAGVAGWSVGCAATLPAPSHGDSATRVVPEASHASLLPLVRSAEREVNRPVRDAVTLPPPPGVEASLLEPLPDGDAQAMSIEDAAAHFAAEAPDAGADQVSDHQPDDEQREAALRSYVSGRQKLLEGDAAAALEDLRRAARLDPASPEVWRELGEAEGTLGNRSDAVAAFRMALALGLEDAPILELLARDAMERRDSHLAAHYLSRALHAQPEADDPLLLPVIEVSLAQALEAEGYLAASSEVLERALQRHTPSATSTRYVQEYGAIVRRKGDLWRQVGDARLRLGQYDRAFAAYQHARENPALEEHLLTGRMVAAAMRAGRPAAAALAVLGDVAESGGLVTHNDVVLLRHIAGFDERGVTTWRSPVRLEIAAAVANYRQALGTGIAPSTEASLTRAQAAALQGAAARPLLREFLLEVALNPHVARDLIQLCSSHREALREAVTITAGRPAAAQVMADALLHSHFSADELLERLTAGVEPGPRLLIAAHMNAAAGRYAAAAELADRLGVDGPHASAVRAARFEFVLRDRSHADWDELEGENPERADSILLLARAFALGQRHHTALELLRPLLEPPDGVLSAAERSFHFEALLTAGEIASAIGRADDAQRWLRAALALDPHDERSYAMLLRLYGPGGPLADAGRSNRILRDLRQHVPDNRTAPLIFAREAARRGHLQQAETAVLELAGADPDMAAIELLAGIWQLQAARGDEEALQRGLDWIQQQRTRWPHMPALLAAAVTLLVGADQGEDAEQLLREALDDGAGRDAARLLEGVLAESRDRRDEAHQLALARLEGRTLIFADALELAEVHAQLQNRVLAAEALADALSPDVSLIADQTRRVQILTAQLGQHAIQSRDARLRTAILEVFGQLVERDMGLAPELHELRLVLIAADPGAGIAEIIAAAELASRQDPAQRWRPFAVAADAAGAAGRGDVAVDLLRTTVLDRDNPEAELLEQWFRTVAISGNAADARVLIDYLHDSGRMNEILESPDDISGDMRAEAAFFFGVRYMVAERDEESLAAYELALEYDPDHGWALNNLGYTLADRGEDLDRAEDLLVRAMAALPGEAPVIDSLGWVRYKRGQIEDEIDPASGQVVREGAVTLLGRAAATDYGRHNPIILDHYGDALWRAGRHEEAQQQWRAARDRARALVDAADRARRMRGMRQAGVAEDLQEIPSDSEVREYRQIRRLTRDKLTAAAAGNDPPVAPQYSVESP